MTRRSPRPQCNPEGEKWIAEIHRSAQYYSGKATACLVSPAVWDAIVQHCEYLIHPDIVVGRPLIGGIPIVRSDRQILHACGIQLVFHDMSPANRHRQQDPQ